MFQRILVPIDGSPTSNRGLEEAMALAQDQPARLCLLYVVDELMVAQGIDGTTYVPAGYVEGFMKGLREDGRKVLGEGGEEGAATRHHRGDEAREHRRSTGRRPHRQAG